MSKIDLKSPEFELELRHMVSEVGYRLLSSGTIAEISKKKNSKQPSLVNQTRKYNVSNMYVRIIFVSENGLTLFDSEFQIR